MDKYKCDRCGDHFNLNQVKRSITLFTTSEAPIDVDSIDEQYIDTMCFECNKSITANTTPSETIEDGFGSIWDAKCNECGKLSMQVVRPGKIQCGYCG